VPKAAQLCKKFLRGMLQNIPQRPMLAAGKKQQWHAQLQ
jgi:hypothetical protein